MKIIKILILPIIFILTILIINNTKDNKVYYMSLGDELSRGINTNNYGYSDLIKDRLKIEKYTKVFTYTNIRVIDLINKIEDNEEKNISIQYALKKSNLITISIGINEIYDKNNIDYNYIDELINNIDYLFKLIRKFNNKKIYFIGYYSINSKLDKYIKYTNNKLIEICNNNSIKYIDTYNIFKSNSHLIYNINNIYPNKDGYRLIANEIIKNM